MFEYLFNHAPNIAALLSVPGAALAFFQLRQSQKSRLASTYLAISKEWDALTSISRLITTSAFETRDCEDHAHRGALLLDILDRRAPFLPEHDIFSIENEILRDDLDRGLDTILSYLEDLGLLCRKGYVSEGDVADIIGPSIVEVVCIMLPYIERERSSYEAGPTIYANTLWLYERINCSTQFGISGYGTPKLFMRPIGGAT
jgi:hypothetical protein